MARHSPRVLRARTVALLLLLDAGAARAVQPPKVPEHPGLGAVKDGNEGQGRLSPVGAAEADWSNRAWPLAWVPPSYRQLASETWKRYGENDFKGGRNANQPFLWDLVGPAHATMPDLLTFSGAQFRSSGRLTAMAISPTCTRSSCRLWVAAAGGGIWRTDNPFSPDPFWVFTSQGFASNAIGTIDLDPNDLAGNTLYAGTGEPNASADSEAGVGVYRTTDGGDSWTLLPATAAFESRSIGKIAVVPGQPGHLYVAVARGIRGYSSVTGGAVSRTQGPVDGSDQAPLGLYESVDGGATFTLAWDGNGSIRGVNDVGLDPQDPGVVYAAAFQKGIWRRDPAKGEVAFTKVFETGKPAENTSRTQLDLTVWNGHTRVYAVDGSLGPVTTTDDRGEEVEVPDTASGLWRVDTADTMTAAELLASQASPRDGMGWDRKTSPTDRPRSAPGRETYDFCTGQCWYDADVMTPKDLGAGGTTFYPDVVYVLGSYSYHELFNASNARGVLLSLTAGEPDPTCRGCTFSDLTWDGTPSSSPDMTHPDQHALVTVPGEPLLYFEGSDGGVIHNDGQFDDVSYECFQRPNDPDSLALCQKLLSRVPHQLWDTANKGLSTLQFQSLSVNPQRPLHDVRTQDNGTFEWTSSRMQWWNVMYGDGGQSGFNYCDPSIRFNEFTGQATDQNFRNGDIRSWVVTSGPLFNNGESAPFYFAEVPDYVNCGRPADFFAANGYGPAQRSQFVAANAGPSGTIGTIGFQYAGLNHVWRTVDNGGPQDYLEATCPEFTTFANDPRCGDWKPLGGPRGRNQPGDLTGTAYGASRVGGNVVAIERSPGDASTAWAATTTGRVFVTHNVNAIDPQAVVWRRLDTIAVTTPPSAVPPPRFVSSISPDPADPNRAFISFSGYNQATRDSPGHVFEVTVAGAAAAWRDLRVEAGAVQEFPRGDLPVTDLVRDDLTGDLYAATDFGVLRGVPTGASYAWTRAGSNLPMVEVAGLTIDPCSRALYAATHGRSAWRMFLPDAAGAPAQGCPRTP